MREGAGWLADVNETIKNINAIDGNYGNDRFALIGASVGNSRAAKTLIGW